MLTSILLSVFGLCVAFVFIGPRFVALSRELGNGGSDNTAVAAAIEHIVGSPILLAAMALGFFGVLGFVVSTIWLIVACFRR